MGDFVDANSAAFASSAVIEKPSIRSTKCRHAAGCDLWGTLCCACSDSRDRAQKCAAGSSGFAEMVKGYCASCKARHMLKHTSLVAQREHDFDLWRKDPRVDRERSGLFVNFVLRQRMPFELAQMTLSFLLEIAPCAFFSTFDRVLRVKPTVKEIMKTRQYVPSYGRYDQRYRDDGLRGCSHKHCDLQVRATKGCCQCLDKRVYRDFDVLYVDGFGDQVVAVPFYLHYCTGCRNHHSGGQHHVEGALF